MEADVAHAMLVLAALRVGGADPEPRVAVGPADRFVVLVGDIEAEKRKQAAVEILGPRIVADADDEVIDAHHPLGFFHSRHVLTQRGQPRP